MLWLLAWTLSGCGGDTSPTGPISPPQDAQNADLGKDHWPHTSVLRIGSGVAAGQAYGQTNDVMEGMPLDLKKCPADPRGLALDNGAFCGRSLAVGGVDSAGVLPGMTPFAPFISV